MAQQFLFELSKEHSTLSGAEIVACLQAEHISFSVVEHNNNVLVIQSPSLLQKLNQLATRLSYTFYIDEFVCSCAPTLSALHQTLRHYPLQQKGSIAIRKKNRSTFLKSKPFLEIIQDAYTKDRTVCLQRPDVEVRLYLTDTKIYIGVKLAELPRIQFEQRKAHLRPFFSPISLHPKLARALVNLSQVRRNETLLDPFCGTGGILLEAGLIGINIIGNDIQKKMITGCKKTLDHFNIKNYSLYCSDIGILSNHIPSYVDCVVTDFPYGRATTTKGEELTLLYERAFDQIQKVLKKGRRAVVGLSSKETISIGEKFLSVLEVHTLRVHRSLTRYFIVYQN